GDGYDNWAIDDVVIGAGIVTAPEIAVEQPAGTNLIDGSATVAFGSVVTGFNASLVFTIRNSGAADLTGLGLTIDGTDAADFSVTSSPTAPVIAGGSTTFTVLAPTAVGTRTAALHLASNDADENPFDIALTGTAVAPAPEIAVEQPAGTDLVDGASTANFSAVLIGAYTTSTFTVRNSGTANLTGLGITINGANAGDFSVTANPAVPVAPGGSTTFTVRFAPAALGIRTAALHLASNDADENPFDINLTGTGTNVTSTIYGNYTPLPKNSSHGANYLLGSLVTITADGELEFFGLDARATGPDANFGLYTDSGGNPGTLVATTGAFNLNVVGYIERAPTEPVTLTAGNYWIMAVYSAGASVGSSNTTTNVVKYRSLTFTSSLPSSFGATTTYTGNDFNYYLKVGARVLAPEIAVEQPAGTDLTDGSSGIDCGSATLGGTPGSRTVTVRNLGTANLTGLALTKDGTDAADFTLGTLGATTLAPGASTTFTVTFAPGAAGARSAALHLASNDSDENPFDLTLTGHGNRAPVFAGYALATRTDQVLSIYPAKILARTSDPDGDAITLTRAIGPSAQGGAVALTTTVTYTPPLGFAGTDSFEVELTDARGAVVRGTITITVTAAPTGIGADGQNRTDFSLHDGIAEMVFRGIPGRSYTIQRSTDLTHWSDQATVAAGTDGKIPYTDLAPPLPQAYYRTKAN
ncbi:MAG: choice-of-anchor D domain-containing protein, partial [Verrucomicrobia bacterium]|nr:choice-of-anchor D domain-containing protein [Verrucomicrobiota bacterium]